jgi:glycine C-acetyltransferase
VDIFEKLRNNSGPIGTPAKMLNSHHYFSFPMLEGELGPRMRFMGREVLNWSLNNYMGPCVSDGRQNDVGKLNAS